jgi:tetratricopeptide (TPR) repeat protein
LALDPASRIIATDSAVILYWQRRYDDADRQLKHVIEMDSGFSEAYLWRARVLLQQKRFGEAIAALETANRLNPRSSTIPPTLAYAYGLAGQRTKASALLQQLLHASPPSAWGYWSRLYRYGRESESTRLA